MAAGGEQTQKTHTEVNRLTCSVCLEPYRNPRLLPCFHTFCTPCLQELADSAVAGRTSVEGQKGNEDKNDSVEKTEVTECPSFLCPTCRKPAAVPPGGVKEFQSNFYLEAVCNETAASKSKSCDVCEENTATHSCTECQQDFCRSCRNFHGRVASTRSHQVELIGRQNSKQPCPKSVSVVCKNFCETHLDQKLLFYCHQCEAAVCLYCKLTSHEGHTTEDMAVAGERMRAEVHQLSLALEKKIEVTDKVIIAVTEEQQQLEQQRQAVMEKAQASAQKLTTWIKEAQDTLSIQMESIADPINKRLQSQLQQAVGTKSTLTDLQNRSKAMLKTGTHADFVRLKSEMKEHNAVVKQTEFTAVSVEGKTRKTFFEHQSDTQKVTQVTMAQFIGTLMPCSISGAVEKVDTSEPSAAFSTCMNVKLGPEIRVSLYSFCFTNDGRILTVSPQDGSRSRLTVFDQEGNCIKTCICEFNFKTVSFFPPNSVLLISDYPQGMWISVCDVGTFKPVSLPFDKTLLAHSKPGGKTYCLGGLCSRVLEVHELIVNSAGHLSNAPVTKIFHGINFEPSSFDVSSDAQYCAVLAPCYWSQAVRSGTPHICMYSFENGQQLFSLQVDNLQDICFSNAVDGKEMLQVMAKSGDYGIVYMLDHKNRNFKTRNQVSLNSPVCFAVHDNGRVAVACNNPPEIIFLPS